MSLQDQLLKAGLVDEKKARKLQQDKRKQNKQNKQKRKGKHAAAGKDEAKLAARKAQAENAERDRQLNQQRKREAEQRAINAQIRQLIEANRQVIGKGDIAYHFADGRKVRHIYVDGRQQRSLSKGELAIVRFDGVYELVPAAVGEKIAARDKSCLIYHSDGWDEGPDQDDPYADYPVPDDLMW